MSEYERIISNLDGLIESCENDTEYPFEIETTVPDAIRYIEQHSDADEDFSEIEDALQRYYVCRYDISDELKALRERVTALPSPADR